MGNQQNPLSSGEAKQQIQLKNWLTFFKKTMVNGTGIDVQNAISI